MVTRNLEPLDIFWYQAITSLFPLSIFRVTINLLYSPYLPPCHSLPTSGVPRGLGFDEEWQGRTGVERKGKEC